MSTVQPLGAVGRQELAAVHAVEPTGESREGCLYSPGPSAGVWRVAPCGANIVAACYDGVVRVYQQVAEGISPPTCLRFHQREALSVCVLGEQFVTGSSDGSIGVWREGRGTPVGKMNERKPRTGIYSIAALAGGMLATGACQKPKRVKGAWAHNIKLWDMSTGRVAGSLVGHTGGIAGLVNMGEGVLASASGDKSVCLWNLETLDQVGGHTQHKDYVYGIARLGKKLITGGRDRTVQVFDVAANTMLGALVDGEEGIAHESTVYDVNTAGPLIVTASRDGYVKLWDSRTMEKIVSLTADDGFVYTANFLTNGNIVAGTAGKINAQTAEAEEAQAVARRGGSTRDFKKPDNAHVVIWDRRK